MDHKITESWNVCSQSRTSDTESAERETTATHNGSLQQTESHNANEKPFNTEQTSHQLKNYKNSDFLTTFLNLSKKHLNFVAEGPHTIDVQNDQFPWEHNFSPYGNDIFVPKGRVKQHQEDMKDFNHKYERPQLKESSSSVNDLLAAFFTIRRRMADIRPQWGEENVCTQGRSTWPAPSKSRSSQVGSSTSRSVAHIGDDNWWSAYYLSQQLTVSPSLRTPADPPKRSAHFAVSPENFLT